MYSAETTLAEEWITPSHKERGARRERERAREKKRENEKKKAIRNILVSTQPIYYRTTLMEHLTCSAETPATSLQKLPVDFLILSAMRLEMLTP